MQKLVLWGVISPLLKTTGLKKRSQVQGKSCSLHPQESGPYADQRPVDVIKSGVITDPAYRSEFLMEFTPEQEQWRT